MYDTEILHPLFFLQLLRANLCIVKELGDRAAQGRTYGNLGNTYYLLGNFRNAVASHEQVSIFWVTIMVVGNNPFGKSDITSFRVHMLYQMSKVKMKWY